MCTVTSMLPSLMWCIECYKEVGSRVS